MTTTIRRWVLAATVLAGLIGVEVRGDELAAVKERMVGRRDAVQALVTRKAAGEDNRGYLDARGSLTAAETAVLAAENADRKLVYTGIAGKTGATAELVGKQRAAAIAKNAVAGTWLQDDKGRWYEKGR